MWFLVRKHRAHAWSDTLLAQCVKWSYKWNSYTLKGLITPAFHQFKIKTSMTLFWIRIFKKNAPFCDVIEAISHNVIDTSNFNRHIFVYIIVIKFIRHLIDFKLVFIKAYNSVPYVDLSKFHLRLKLPLTITCIYFKVVPCTGVPERRKHASCT